MSGSQPCKHVWLLGREVVSASVNVESSVGQTDRDLRDRQTANLSRGGLSVLTVEEKNGMGGRDGRRKQKAKTASGMGPQLPSQKFCSDENVAHAAPNTPGGAVDGDAGFAAHAGRQRCHPNLEHQRLRSACTACRREALSVHPHA